MRLPPPLDGWWLVLKGAWAGIRTGLWIALVLAACLYGRACERKAQAAERAQAAIAAADARAKSAEALATLTTEYRNRERAMGDAFIAASAEHAKDIRRVETERSRLVAGLLSGADRLQDRWAGCVSAASGAAAGPGSADAAARDRAESAGRIVAAAAHCDAQVAGLQSILTAERTP